MLQLHLIVRKHCHLCDLLAVDLEQMKTRFALSYDIVDVDSSWDLISKYGNKVPVLLEQDHEIASGKVDREALSEWFERRQGQ